MLNIWEMLKSIMGKVWSIIDTSLPQCISNISPVKHLGDQFCHQCWLHYANACMILTIKAKISCPNYGKTKRTQIHVSIHNHNSYSSQTDNLSARCCRNINALCPSALSAEMTKSVRT